MVCQLEGTACTLLAKTGHTMAGGGPGSGTCHVLTPLADWPGDAAKEWYSGAGNCLTSKQDVHPAWRVF